MSVSAKSVAEKERACCDVCLVIYHQGESKMFSVAQKRDIAEKVQAILRGTGHPKLPEGEINFVLHVEGNEPSWQWADIENNGAVDSPSVNPWNEEQDPVGGVK